MRRKSLKFAAGLLAGIWGVTAQGQDAAETGEPGHSPAIPEAADGPYPGGAITLDIDASDVLRGLYRVTETVPVAPGTRRMTLLHPEWLPGNHAPRGPIAELVDLRFLADGRPVKWRRDVRDVYAFHVDLPDNTRTLVAKFIHTSPLEGKQGRVTMTPEMLNLQWEKMSLYPAGHQAARIAVKPRVTLPPGWTAATALKGKSHRGNVVSWAETDYETLVDSPIFAGAYFREWSLGNSVGLSAVADAPELLSLEAGNQQKLSALIEEALLTFGAAPFDRYDFLVALSDRLGGIGLEHLRSSENQLEPRNFAAWANFGWDRNVLSHELVHAWNGKYRRPARLWTPDYRTPMQDDLLWVYEGQTQFWGWVLAARSGLQEKDMVLGMIARAVGLYSQQPGREWRSVGDTTLDPVVSARKSKPFGSLARGEDYYNEGALIWLEVDQVIGKGTGGRKGLDDFARAFFAHKDGTGRVSTYEFGDVVAALKTVYPYDWASFLRDRIDAAGRPAPIAGIEQAGYRLVWKDHPNPYSAARMQHLRRLSLYHSLGLSVDQQGKVGSARWGGPAFEAGIVTGVTIVAVNGAAFDPAGLKQAITGAATDRTPIELLIRRGDRFSTVRVAYYGGLRWPWLEKAGGKGAAPLDRLLSPRRKNILQ